MTKGIGVSPGVAVGPAYCVDEIFVRPGEAQLSPEEAQAEWSRFEHARDRAIGELDALQDKLRTQVGAEEADVFRAQEAVLRDPAFLKNVRQRIVVERRTAPTALHRLFQDNRDLQARTKDPFLKRRLSDARDALVRLSGHLSPVLEPHGGASPGPVIVVAKEILPWHIMAMGNLEIAAIVTQTGGRTSHAAILARRRGIPAVTAARNILNHCSNGDILVVDGRNGQVIINPDPEQESAYRKLQREFVDLRGHLAENRDRPARTADGVDLELAANINGYDDVVAAAAMGADGVGLYRTEYLFLAHPSVPDEEEQLADYRRVIAAAPGRKIVIRTLDLGGDKTIPFLGHDREANPFMGWRSIRLSFEHPDFFLTQIRAVMRAAAADETAGADVKLLFPMITALEEIRRIRTMVRKAARQLEAEKKPFRTVPIGLMLEVPAAAITLESLARDVDFVSIGTNDLVQYLMAADRDNPKVSRLCEPLSPPVLRVLQRAIGVCRRMQKPVCLCGEMAGQPRAFVLLLGMGLRWFSMSPALIPAIKDLAAHVTVERARDIVDDVMRLTTTAKVIRHLNDRLHELAPNLELLETE